MQDLTKCDGRRFRARIDGVDATGRITVESGVVYLCQNARKGKDCRNKRGYNYSWAYMLNGEVLYGSGVEELRLMPTTADEIAAYKDWQVGDRIRRNGGEKGVIIFRSGDLVIFKNLPQDTASLNYTCDELYRHRWCLDEEPEEEKSPAEIFIEQVEKLAAKLGISTYDLSVEE